MSYFIRLIALTVALGIVVQACSHAFADPPNKQPFTPLRDEDAWKKLPRENPPLPVWARLLAEALPGTTVRMLELDHLHRAGNPLGAVLAGKLRLWAADAVGGEYARRYAASDLLKAGVTEEELKKLTGDANQLSKDDLPLARFARRVSVEAYKLTDREMDDLLKKHGPEKVTAMVHTLAFAAFQNRIFLALGVEVEANGPLAPVEIKLDPKIKPNVPARPAWQHVLEVRSEVSGERPAWLGSTMELDKALEGQKNRKPRIPMPDPERLAQFPPEVKERSGRIVWSVVSLGYQPVLTKTWFDCMSTFQQEANLDRVFSNTMFWVITRSNECFY